MAIDGGWVTEHLRVEDRSIHCRRSVGGSGPPLVHIHGFGISGAYLMPTARLLAGRWVNVVPDLPGYGLSERRDHVLDIPALAGALLAVLDALDIEQAVLVGNSMGCLLEACSTSSCPARSASWRWTWRVRARGWSRSRCRTT